MSKILGVNSPKPEHVKNYIINGNFDIWQRGTSFSTPTWSTYNADRFMLSYDGTIGTFTISRQAFSLGQTDVPNEPAYFLRWDQTVAGSGSTHRVLGQKIESVRTLAGKTVTASLWIKADASRVSIVTLTQLFGTGGSPSAEVNVILGTINLTTSWQKISFTTTLASIAGKTLGTNNDDQLRLLFYMPSNTTMTIDIAQIMLNEGPVAAPFQTAGDNIEEELSMCQRYYHKTFPLATTPAQNAGTNGSVVYSATRVGAASPQFSGSVSFPVRMRAYPTMIMYNPSAANTQIRDATIGGDCSGSGVGGAANDSMINFFCAGNASTTIGNSLNIHYTAEAEL